jgi:hypothetical protein
MSIRRLARILPHQCNMIRVLNKSNTAYIPFHCLDKEVIIHNGTDAYLTYEFPKARTVIFNNCDSNFLYYNFTRQKFPVLQRFYTNGEPCEPSVLRRFANNPDYIGYITSNHYRKHLNKWWTEDTHYLKEIEQFDYEVFLGTFEQVSPKLELNIYCNSICEKPY